MKSNKDLIRLATWAADEALDLFRHNSKFVYENIEIDLRTYKFRTFKRKGINCAFCGIKGSFFALEKNKKDKVSNFNLQLYALDNNGNEILMTRDHIIPLSKGGRKSSVSNSQPMCYDCNQKKASLTIISQPECFYIINEIKL